MSKKNVLVGFYTDEDGKVKPITKSRSELTQKQIVQKAKEFKGIKPSWKRRPIFLMMPNEVHVGVYDSRTGVVGSVPLESYDPKLMHRGYKATGKSPGSLKGFPVWNSPDLTPSKLAQRKHVANKVGKGGTVLELFAGKGNLSREVWSKNADKLVLVDKKAEYLKDAKTKLKGRVRSETIIANNKVWLRKHMNPEDLKNLRVVDFDAFGSPAVQVQRFFGNFKVKKSMFICLTDGSNIFLAFHRDLPTGHKFLREKYGVDFKKIEGNRHDQVKALDGLMRTQGRKHGFKVEPINLGFGKHQTVYAAYKIIPKRKKKKK